VVATGSIFLAESLEIRQSRGHANLIGRRSLSLGRTYCEVPHNEVSPFISQLLATPPQADGSRLVNIRTRMRSSDHDRYGMLMIKVATNFELVRGSRDPRIAQAMGRLRLFDARGNVQATKGEVNRFIAQHLPRNESGWGPRLHTSSPYARRARGDSNTLWICLSIAMVATGLIAMIAALQRQRSTWAYAPNFTTDVMYAI